MGVLEVSGIRVYAYHGCLKEEGSIGGHYCVDVRLEGDMTSAETNDRLTDAIDYCQVAAIVRSQMAVRSALIRPCFSLTKSIATKPPAKKMLAEPTTTSKRPG